MTTGGLGLEVLAGAGGISVGLRFDLSGIGVRRVGGQGMRKVMIRGTPTPPT